MREQDPNERSPAGEQENAEFLSSVQGGRDADDDPTKPAPSATPGVSGTP